MGAMQHDAIIIEGTEKGVRAAAREARQIFQHPKLRFHILGPFVNGRTFLFIPPDGSKDGWDTSKEWDEKRSVLKDALKLLQEKFDYMKTNEWVDYIEVSWGDNGYWIVSDGKKYGEVSY
jgi:hypothetical protein